MLEYLHLSFLFKATCNNIFGFFSKLLLFDCSLIILLTIFHL